MNIEAYRDYCVKKKQVTEGFPFPNLSNVLVFKVAGKMFSATDVTSFATISIGCDSKKVGEMRAKYTAVIKLVILVKDIGAGSRWTIPFLT